MPHTQSFPGGTDRHFAGSRQASVLAAALNKTIGAAKCTSVALPRCVFLLLTRSTARVPEQKSSAMLS